MKVSFYVIAFVILCFQNRFSFGKPRNAEDAVLDRFNFAENVKAGDGEIPINIDEIKNALRQFERVAEKENILRQNVNQGKIATSITLSTSFSVDFSYWN